MAGVRAHFLRERDPTPERGQIPLPPAKGSDPAPCLQVHRAITLRVTPSAHD